MMSNSEARKRANPGIPAGVLVERIEFLLETAYLHASAGNNEGVYHTVNEVRQVLAQLRESV